MHLKPMLRSSRGGTPPAVQRVMMTTTPVGSVWTYALELSRALAERGVRVELATLGAPLSAAQWMEAREVPGLGLHEGQDWHEGADEDAWLLDLEARLSPDVVHLNDHARGALAWRAPTLVMLHTCPLVWWDAVMGGPAPERYARYRQEAARGLRGAGCVVAPSMAMLSAAERLHGPFGATRVIPHARRAESFLPDAKESFVLAAGRDWDEAGNLAVLEAIAPRLPFPVRIAGETSRGSSSRSLGTLRPWELAGWMARAAVYAMPARYEPFGLSALEAALAGCALVLGDIPSLREVWGDAALFVHPDDEDGLAAALRWLMLHPSERECRAGRARSRALSFTPRRMVDAYLDVYTALSVRPPESWAVPAIRAS
ncbi:glycosyltransferase family 4 protein [Melittangium boletus]|uniref:Glycosyl transferase group 1 n=1 Tax=Melittangium boletus DSM 14713 TaxID=1294270 RepID=A0A250ICN8_9BACT|nr:glycosyltransferase family 4 protein [Melittangium boletus]ATB28897.1 glycosyl transferase group 1 [Melittangium boletus DSM 14713]